MLATESLNWGSRPRRPKNGRPLGASRPACTMAARHRQTERLHPQTKRGQGHQPRRQSGIWRGTHAALVFNGQHTGLPSREWRFKSATLLQARQPDVYRGWNETFTFGRDVIRLIERIAQFGGPGEAGTSHTKAATATTVATHRKGAPTYDFLGEMVYRPKRNVAAPCAHLADLTPPPAHRNPCAPVPRHERRADEKRQALSCWLHLTGLDWGASTHTDTKIHSTFLL